MTLAALVAADRDALLCDMAQTYHVFDLRALPVQTVAVLAAGLPESSRIKCKLSGASLPISELLLAAILDGVNLLVWMRTEDAKHGRNRPRSVLGALTDGGDEKGGYDSPEAFEAAREKLWREINHV